MTPRHLLDDLFDLVLGRACLACDALGPTLCPACLQGMRGRATPVAVPGLRQPAAATTAYEGLGRQVVLEYKERGNRSLAPMLGRLLADAVLVHAEARSAAACVLVPVPAHRHAPRGFDALAAISRACARALTGDALPTRIQGELRSAAAYRPVKGLGRTERGERVAGAFRPAPSGRVPPGERLVVLVDDVLTTGSTVTEAVRTLEAAGHRVDAVAAIAAASRDRPARIPAPAPPRIRR